MIRAVDALAAYAAVVATAAIAWQIFTWRRERQTRIEVQLSNAFIGRGVRGVEAAALIARLFPLVAHVNLLA